MSKVTAYYHIVFRTKSREMTIPLEHCEHLYRFIWKIVKEMKCDLLRIGGIQNHVHMLIDLHPSVSLAHLMQHIKGRSSTWMGSDIRFMKFRGWAAEYYGCTISPEWKYAVIEYIKSQMAHHNVEPIDVELSGMYRYAGLNYDARDLT